MSKECLQQKLPIGTPCFQIDVKRTICSLDYCPVAKHLENQALVLKTTDKTLL